MKIGGIPPLYRNWFCLLSLVFSITLFPNGINACPIPQQLDILETYPFSACKCAVVDDQFNQELDPICFMGSGGGIYIVDTAVLDPHLIDITQAPYTNVESRMLRTGGFAWDLSVTVKGSGDEKEHWLLCAAWHAGLAGWMMTENGSSVSMTKDPAIEVPLGSPTRGARGVDSFIYNSTVYAVVGTFEDWDDGYLYLIRIYFDPVTNQYEYEIEDTHDVQAGIYRLDATTELDVYPTVFVAATAGGVQRYSIDFSDPNNPCFDYEAGYCPPEGIFARDVLVDTSTDTLYAACYQDAILTFTVSSPGSLNKFPSTWPQSNYKAADGLGLITGDALLFVAYGPILQAEVQFWGDNDKPVPPTGDQMVAEGGLYIYDISDPASPQLDGYILPPRTGDLYELYGSPVDVVVLPDTPENRAYMVLDANGMGAMRMFPLTPPPPPFEYEVTGYYNHAEQAPDVPVPLGCVDDCIIRDNFLYTSSERGVQAYRLDVTPPAKPLDEMFKCNFHGGAITLCGRSGKSDLLYSYNHKGTVFWDISDPSDPLFPKPSTKMLNWTGGDRVALCYAIGSGNSWRLYQAIHSTKKKHGALAVWKVDNYKDPRYCTRLVRFDGSLTSARGDYIDVAVVQNGSDQVAYVTYGPTDVEGEITCKDAGLHSFRITEPISGVFDIEHTHSIVVNWGTSIPPDFGQGARLVLSDDETRLYGSFGRGGIAVFDLQNKTQPSMIGKRRLEEGSTLQIRPFNATGKTLAYVTLLSGYLVVMDVTDQQAIENGDYIKYRTIFQANNVIFDPSDPSHQTLFITDGRGGVSRVHVPTLP